MEGRNETIYVPSDSMRTEMARVLAKIGFSHERAALCADIFTVNSLEGVYSHGINRFYRFVKTVNEGFIKPEANPSLVGTMGSVERWDGNLGPGPLNAIKATDRAVSLAETNGIGMVAMKNTNHWMRGGTYGWQAARKGYIFIGWTNTEANLPAWGSREARLGNNPLIIAVPFGSTALVLDSAMTQFSYGKMETYKLRGELLPMPGGFDSEGRATNDPAVILQTRRALPAGYWKGSSTALVLDILASALSGGRSTAEITASGTEYGVSQVFIAVNPLASGTRDSFDSIIRKIIDDFRKSLPDEKNSEVRYPGENVAAIREQNLARGIPVTRLVWDKILSL